MNGVRRADLHVHSSFSDGEEGVEGILHLARAAGVECVAVTDHFDPFDPSWRHLSEEALCAHLERIREAAAALPELRVLCGIETCTDFAGRLRVSDRVRRACDLIITSPHYVEYDGELAPGNHFDERYWNRYKEKVLHMAGGEGDILGHCEGYLPYGKLLAPGSTTYEERQELARRIADRYFDAAYLKDLAAALKASGKAAELHCATRTPRIRVIDAFVAAGVNLSAGSDAHRGDAVGRIDWAMRVIGERSAWPLLVRWQR